MIDRRAMLHGVFQPDERLLLAKALDQADFSLKRRSKAFTDFIDPAKMAMVIDALKDLDGINFCVFGGHADCERRIVGFCPDFCEIEENEFPLKAVNITVNAKFSQSLSHRDFLGAVLGLGIDRGKIGDIVISDEGAAVFAFCDIADYLAANLERVGRTAVKTEAVDISLVRVPERKTVEKRATVSSLRLDAVVGAAFSISRGKASALIEGERVLLNWTVAANVSKPVKEGDMVSVRGLGRSRIAQIGGKTKKDRIGIVFEKYV